MISVKLKGDIGGLGPGSASLMRRLDMERLGNFAIRTLWARVDRGIGSDGIPMPPLKAKRITRFQVGAGESARSVGYAGWKARHGLKPIRDLVGDGSQGGHMRDNFTVRLATETLVRMAFTKKRAREKALANEKRAPFLGFTQEDRQKINAEAVRMFGANVRDLGFVRALKAFRKKAA